MEQNMPLIFHLFGETEKSNGRLSDCLSGGFCGPSPDGLRGRGPGRSGQLLPSCVPNGAELRHGSSRGGSHGIDASLDAAEDHTSLAVGFGEEGDNTEAVGAFLDSL